MSVNKIIWIMWFYIVVQYLFGRYVATQLNKCDPGYFGSEGTDGKLPVGMKSSLGVTRMILDFDLPDQSYSATMKVQIYLARVLFFAALPVLILIFFV